MKKSTLVEIIYLATFLVFSLVMTTWLDLEGTNSFIFTMSVVGFSIAVYWLGRLKELYRLRHE